MNPIYKVCFSPRRSRVGENTIIYIEGRTALNMYLTRNSSRTLYSVELINVITEEELNQEYQNEEDYNNTCLHGNVPDA